jgi:hypothetical protein
VSTHTEEIVAQEQREYEADTQIIEPDPDAGKLFDVPRANVALDDSDPSALRLTFSGAIQLNRDDPDDVAVYNRLREGRPAVLNITAHVAGSRLVHRRDKEGYVDAIVASKSLVIHSIDT